MTVSSSIADQAQSPSEFTSSPKEIEVFFDGDCPLCLREINMLRRMDKRNKIEFTNIADACFEPDQLGKTYQELMDEIHGRLPDGELITGVEVFRRLYSAVGLTWLVKPTRLPGVSHALDVGYRVFARNRLRFTGRCRGGACELPN